MSTSRGTLANLEHWEPSRIEATLVHRPTGNLGGELTASETNFSSAPVVVGVDGSAASLEAVALAAREAILRNRPLHVVHAFIWPLMRVPLGPSPSGPPEGGFRNQAAGLLDEAVARARAVAPDALITSEIITGDAGPVLLRCAATAHLVAIGDRGLGGFSGLLLGSVAVKLAAQSDCPVLVSRGEVHAAGPVVVGVDGSAANEAAVGFAFDSANRRGATLLAVHAWSHPASTVTADMMELVYDRAAVQADEERQLADALARWQMQYPDVTVIRSVSRAGASKALVEASSDSQLVVVGARGRGGLAGLLLGSVSQAVLHHAACPVAVVPASAGGRE